jgi:glycosyltransferase involved in cell wall biosynthesis
MTYDAQLSFATDDWAIPSFDVALYGPRVHLYALVIPVINEGERIRSQLTHIHDAMLPVDIVVADGGSVDGSLESAFVSGAGVRAVLTKTGPGYLSAQLRMAYSWCLQQGYAGIVTIDGNGKDGVEAVVDMVAKLKEGYDYVQGSRYLPGGVAENTPLERTIANRYIHAPLLSLAGRHWFTDTTSGFRAYSSRYLTDPRVRPFRDEFQRYGLIFYLTVRAGQLGLKVGQVPVTRRYPANAKVPTKITGPPSKLMVLGETIFAATGGYTPTVVMPSNPRWIWPFLVTLLVALPIFLGNVVAPNFSPDSWAYYELGQTVFTDFYRYVHFRTYWTFTPYSASFPPLFPVSIAIFDAFLQTGARSGFYLAFLSFVIFALLSEKIGRQAFGTAWLGLGMALLLLLGPAMLTDELTAGRTIPTQLVLFAIVLLGLLKAEQISAVGALGLGFLSGLAILNRFDAVMLPILTACALWWISQRPNLGLLVLVGAAAAVSPWIIYSVSTFGVPFASDNSGVAKAIDPRAFVTDWWPVAQPTIHDDPAAWLARILGNSASFAKSIVGRLLSQMSLVLAMALVVLFGVKYLITFRQIDVVSRTPAKGGLNIIAIFTAITLLLLMPQILTGYVDARYFTPLFWSGYFLIAGWSVLKGQTEHQRQVFARMIFTVIALATTAHSGLVLVKSAAAGKLDLNGWSQFEAPKDVLILDRCVKGNQTARILVLGSNNIVPRAGAQGRLRTMMEPRNMADGSLNAEGSRSFVAVWDVSYVLVTNNARKEFAEATFNLVRVADCPLMLFKVLE